MTESVQHRGQCLLAVRDLLMPPGHLSRIDLCLLQLCATPLRSYEIPHLRHERGVVLLSTAMLYGMKMGKESLSKHGKESLAAETSHAMTFKGRQMDLKIILLYTLNLRNSVLCF